MALIWLLHWTASVLVLASLVVVTTSPQPPNGHASSLSNSLLSPTGARRNVLIWLYDCHEDTLLALANHSSAFTAVAPAMYAVGFNSNGGAELTETNAWCSDSVHKYLPDKELWAWVESPNSMNRTNCPNCAEDAVMRELFARPQAYIAAAKIEAAKRNITGFQFDFESPGQANNANKSMWLDTLRFHETFAAALAPQGTLTSVAVMCTANVTGNASARAPQRFCGNGPFVRLPLRGSRRVLYSARVAKLTTAVTSGRTTTTRRPAPRSCRRWPCRLTCSASSRWARTAPTWLRTLISSTGSCGTSLPSLAMGLARRAQA